jgi:hypothetical protein
MTLFLWHTTAYLFAVITLWPLGLGRSSETDARWWLERPVWLVVPAAFLVVPLAVFGRFERPRSRRPSTSAATRMTDLR